MKFACIAKTFATSEAGTDSFKDLWKSSFELMKEDHINAASYFIIGQIARAYVLQYEDQAVDAERANKTKKQIEQFNQYILSGLNAPAKEKLELLSTIAYEYQWTITDF